ncbi:hypothetical protein [Streptomyces sp. NPDC058155]|uniref:hypothetical protein n=1 Tax=Streptomyces sp. NPDC058155 TaxID=3346359 RepID=UPI0036E57957
MSDTTVNDTTVNDTTVNDTTVNDTAVNDTAVPPKATAEAVARFVPTRVTTVPAPAAHSAGSGLRLGLVLDATVFTLDPSRPQVKAVPAVSPS